MYRIQQPWPVIFILLVLLLSSGCSTHHYKNLKKNAEMLAVDAGFKPIYFDTKWFQIYGLEKIKVPINKKLIIYIEGDGQAWKTRFKISKNPTPRKPLSLYLAIQDSYENIIYLARPCQFVDAEITSNCSPEYWTSHRYGEKVLNSYHAVLNQIRKSYNIKNFEIVGYSGGGVIAALLAGQRHDVSRLTTVASNLDHFKWTQHHKVSPLKGSLDLYSNDLDFATIVQRHFWGAQDEIVNYEMNKVLLEKLDNTYLKYYIYEQFNHSCCWVENWGTIKYKE